MRATSQLLSYYRVGKSTSRNTVVTLASTVGACNGDRFTIEKWQIRQRGSLESPCIRVRFELLERVVPSVVTSGSLCESRGWILVDPETER